MYILDWNCFYDNVCSFQSLPLSKSFREIRLEGKWVPYASQTVSGFFNFPQQLIWTRTVRRRLRFFFIPRRLESLTVCRWHWKGSTSRQLFKDPDRGLVRPGFETAASRSPVLIHLKLTGRRFNSPVLHYQVNLRLSRQKWESVANLQCNHPRMSFNYHGLSSTDYHA